MCKGKTSYRVTTDSDCIKTYKEIFFFKRNRIFVHMRNTTSVTIPFRYIK